MADRADIEAALADLVAKVKAHYGPRLSSIFRIDRDAELEDVDRSDAEIVVLVADGDWRSIDEHRTLAALAFETVMERNVYIRAWPVASSSWRDPSNAEHPRLIREFRSVARELGVAA